MADPLLIEIFRSNQLRLINSYDKFFRYYPVNLNGCAISEFIRTRNGMNSVFKFLKDCNIAHGSPKIPNDTINDSNVYSHVRLKHKQKRKWKRQDKQVVNLSIENFNPRCIREQGALSAYFGLVKSILGTPFDEENLQNFYHQIWYDSIVPFMLDHLNWMNESLSSSSYGSLFPSDYSSSSHSIKELSYDLNNTNWLINGILTNVPLLIDRITSSIDHETINDCVGYLLQRGIILLSPVDQDCTRLLFDKSVLNRGVVEKSISYHPEHGNKYRHMFIYTIVSTICEWCLLTNNENANFNLNLGVFPMIEKENEYNLFIGIGGNLKPFSTSIDSQVLIPILFETTETIRASLTRITDRLFSSQSGRCFIPCIVIEESTIAIYYLHRSGAFSTESIDIITEPLKVCKLFLSFLLMDEQNMGFDTSLRIDRKIPYKEFTYWTHPRNGIEYLLKDINIQKDPFGASICVRQVFMKREEEMPAAQETHFLKTFWQEISERRNSAGSINNNPITPREVMMYQIAAENRVRFVPKCIDFGYMYYPDGQLQDTNSIYYKYLSTDTNIRLRNRAHTWMLLSVPGKPDYLYRSKSLQDIFLCLRDIVISHWDMYKAGILHRNICKESLWLVKDDQGLASGLLAGLDKALQVDMKGECEANYKGDRRYAAIGLLKNTDHHHQFIHDLESIFWWLVIEAFPIETSTWEYLYFRTLAERKEEFINEFLKSSRVYDTVQPLYKAAVPFILELQSIVFDIAGRAAFDERWMYDEVEQSLSNAAIDSKVQRTVLIVDENDGVIEMREEE